MNRSPFCRTSVAAVLVGASLGLAPHTAPAGPSAAPAGTTPNVLVILVDDVGPDQLACYDPDLDVPGMDPGSNLFTGAYPYAPTPTITSLAEDGVRFTRGFTTPVCSPSRAMLMTGRYGMRTQIGGIVTPHGKANQPPFNRALPQLPNSEYLLPEVLAAFAPTYTTALFGKWHMTGDKCRVPPTIVADVDGDDHPSKAGWPIYRGILRNLLGKPNPSSEGCITGRATYYDWFEVENQVSPPPYTPCAGAPPGACIPPSVCSLREWEQTYLTTRERESVEDFCLTTAEPWCAVWASQACHGPFDWPPQALHGYGNEPFDLLNAEVWLRFLAVLQSFDTELGKLKTALSQGEGETLWDRTVVLLVGDNGTDAGAVVDAKLRVPGILDGYVEPEFIDGKATRFKGNPYVSGTNMLLVMSGAGIVNPGRADDGLVDMVDVFSTILDVCGVPANWVDLMGFDGRTIDGTSFLPTFEDLGSPARTESLTLHYSPNGPFETANLPDNYQIGFAKKVASGALYHLIQREGEDDEFYQLCDASGNDVDTAEANPLPLTHAEYQGLVDSLRGLLESD